MRQRSGREGRVTKTEETKLVWSEGAIQFLSPLFFFRWIYASSRDRGSWCVVEGRSSRSPWAQRRVQMDETPTADKNKNR
jgi:hypothetical protein